MNLRQLAVFSALSLSILGLSCTPKGASPESPPATQSATGANAVGPSRTEAGKEGRGMLPGNALGAFQLSGATDRASAETIAVSGMPFSEATRATVLTRGDDPWTMQLQARSQTAISAGDVMLASFWVRCERSKQESGEGQTEFVLELAQDPWSKSVSQAVRVGQEWQEVHVPFTAAESYPVGGAQIIFRLGYEPQIIDIAALRLHNFGSSLTVKDLPETKVSYRGREADAAWRKDAALRIDQHRKGDLEITVLGKDGKPAKDAVVQVKQERHSFWFGTAAVTELLARPDESGEYLTRLKENFNAVVLENGLKWKPLEGDWGGGWSVENAESAIDWARKNNMKTRGHVLVWPSWKHLPNRLAAFKDDKAALKKEVEDHVKSLATRMKGKLDHWDVINEPYDNHDLMDLLGDEVMIDWFKIADAADPNAKLYLNDYSILSGGAGETGHRAHFEKTARFLIDGGAPIDGLGLQGHFGTALTAPDDLIRILDRYAALGKPLIITEYDITAEDQELAADYTRDFYTALFSHPGVTGIMMWGFFDGRHWKKMAPLYSQDWKLKKSGEAYQKLVLGEWLTRQEVRTDGAGKVTVRGFLGTYSVTGADGSVTETAVLEKAGTQVTLRLK